MTSPIFEKLKKQIVIAQGVLGKICRPTLDPEIPSFNTSMAGLKKEDHENIQRSYGRS